jgi:hypothetical protein
MCCIGRFPWLGLSGEFSEYPPRITLRCVGVACWRADDYNRASGGSKLCYVVRRYFGDKPPVKQPTRAHMECKYFRYELFG